MAGTALEYISGEQQLLSHSVNLTIRQFLQRHGHDNLAAARDARLIAKQMIGHREKEDWICQADKPFNDKTNTRHHTIARHERVLKLYNRHYVVGKIGERTGEYRSSVRLSQDEMIE
jgi:hypothetical protein